MHLSGGSCIPCEICGDPQALEYYEAHVLNCQQRHQGIQCSAHREEDRLQRSRRPADIAMLLVDMVRRAGERLPGTHDTAREICNFDVVLTFVEKALALGGEGALEIAYHWTRKENIQLIVENNLRAPGAVNADGSTVAQAHGAVYGRGIYAAINIAFGAQYGRGAPCALLCLALPGRVQDSKTLSSGYDSLRHGDLRVYASSAQLLPLFLTNRENDAASRATAEDVVNFFNFLK
jgi:hypothetical protein